ncbi:hypothetical protein SSP24_06150 [Streptomyces spinoverrucosus]|uniref:PLAT domain-containing protein n=1 Tax=Streptomyces spinoverrucosus TaxID=284043 RepID=A0A4Y3VAW5_9ACTN|nr:hypothetical protein [Streptomyces spinoverrucosus]GEC02960.1 hypothetical protein SSP24_06150 [Streptomyces spinoverrucosus]GHB39275.1 hypothetical protein GCM10010397_06440 [Streptomyces spinoverrucosus]
MRTDIKNHISVAQTIAPAAHTATATGTGVDLAGFDAAAVQITVGAVANNAFSVEIQESDQQSTGYTAVANADLDGTEPATLTASTTTLIGYHGIKRYIRAVATDAGTGDAVFGVSVIRGNGRVKP